MPASTEVGKLIVKADGAVEVGVGKYDPVGVARMADVPLAVDMFRYMGGWATKITGSTIPLSFPGEFLSYTLREPVGVGRSLPVRRGGALDHLVEHLFVREQARTCAAGLALVEGAELMVQLRFPRTRRSP